MIHLTMLQQQQVVRNVTVTGAPASTQLQTNELAAHQHIVNLGVISGGPVQYPQISFAQYYPSGFYTRPVSNFNNSHNHAVGNLSGNAFSPYVVVNYIIKTQAIYEISSLQQQILWKNRR